ncbi:MAG: hypothetical protein WC804_07825 [Sphingomonas sp.]|uniref:hypothetical protein n=1 Tax=Sphingomonas sp. TaxID=28214 RepID=UPI00356A1C71
MNFFRRISPIKAFADLYGFLRQRRRHEIVFLVLSFSLTWGMFTAFMIDTRIVRPYKRDIVYVQQWRADRTDAQIIAQQKLDLPKERAALEAQAKADEQRRLAFKHMDDQLKAVGLD